MQQENSIIHNYMVMIYMLIGFAVFIGASMLYVIRYVIPYDNKHYDITHMILRVDNTASKSGEGVNLLEYWYSSFKLLVQKLAQVYMKSRAVKIPDHSLHTCLCSIK